MCTHILQYVEYLLAPPAQLDRETARDMDISDATRAHLTAAAKDLRGMLYDGKAEFKSILGQWYHASGLTIARVHSSLLSLRRVHCAGCRYNALSKECATNDNGVMVDAATKCMCTIQAHLCVMMRSAPLNAERVRELVAATAFLVSRRQWNRMRLDPRMNEA